MTQEDLATAALVTRSSVASYETNRSNVPDDVLARIADSLKTSITELTTEPTGLMQVRPIPMMRVPVIGRVAAGDGAFNVDPDPDDYIEVPTTLSIPAEQVLAWKVEGDSMMPDLEDGDTVVFRPSVTNPRNRRAYLIRCPDGAVKLKLLVWSQITGDWHTRSLNPRYEDHPLGDCQVLGMMVGYYKVRGTGVFTAIDPEGLLLQG